MRKGDTFESERLCFRGISEADADVLVRWRSDPDLIRYYYNPNPINKETHLRWYYQSYLPDQDRFDFIIQEKASKAKIGFVSVKDISREESSGEISYTIAERDFQRKGYAKEAILALMEYLRPQITQIYAVIHQDNIPSIRTVTSLGFEESGVYTERFVRYRKENL